MPFRSARFWLVLAVLLTASGVLPIPARAEDSPCFTPGTPGCAYGLPAFQYELLLGEMVAHPTPNVRPLDVSIRDVQRYTYLQVAREGVTLYNAPGGSPMGAIDPGFNFVEVINSSGDWVEVERGKWTPRSNLKAVGASTFAGVLIDSELAYPMAWLLQPTAPSEIPGQKPTAGTAILPRYTRVNLFTHVTVGRWRWYLIAPGQWVEQRQIGKIVPRRKPEGLKGRWISVDLYEQVLVAYEDQRPVFATLIASGLPQWPTREGLFRIWARFVQDGMTGAMGQPDFYSLPAVPYVMYFDEAISLHGTYWHDGFGYRHSHGCVNMSVTDSRWLFNWTDNFYRDTYVYVWASGTY
ncbi:MAG TPA: L,D-transpeptidase [Aggregatilineales bacterium]|nr:L,D-transpeptidase family protein [Anaerolineales bacterium]HRE48666.1 L,D-transpeptidase [Aggregatilineales bacterium]